MAAMTVAKAIDSTIVLNDGTVIPMFGLGVYRIDDNCSGVIAAALKQGYLLIDTAEFYNNEISVGIGIQQSGKKREEIFVISKWWPTNEGANGALKSLDLCLKNLQSHYVDLYMIHAPKDGYCRDAYQALMGAKKEGKIRSLGVSNFGIQHLDALAKLGLEKPSVNQIQIHPWCQNRDIVRYCRENDITVVGYSPLAKAKKMDDKNLVAIAEK
ncbi:unnamed protein product [Rotaria socialis]|uniref:NADP-dependent oxidoreductase domain-containing protein n=1 Tax=Rotaria socialis TaxID=392032 RepID=A0A817P1Y2_9BILA|nr:unnamed protein product [Rotaria socialis]CAF3362305.1 unnamed protein product [Rotaria socialis]CAF3488159.1 unnamed protein product [Rotaria socialis]CAF4466121.1 unnamed protein product [Rotaria socialis]CAF4663909.1 unnamed protein product [Rotaria socialis]